jgi:hypothetical protein
MTALALPCSAACSGRICVGSYVGARHFRARILKRNRSMRREHWQLGVRQDKPSPLRML